MPDEAAGPSPEELHAHVDGLLDEESRRRVEAWLSANPDAAARLAEYSRLNGQLRSMFDGVAEEAIPPRLARLARPPRPAPRSGARSLRRALLPACAVLLGLLAGWLGRGGFDARETLTQSLIRDAVGAHEVYAADKRRPVELDAAREDDLTRWLSNRLGGEVRAPDLAAEGYRLIGGRLLAFDRKPAAQFMYQDASGKRVTLFLVRAGTRGVDTEPLEARWDSRRAFYWIDDDLACVVTGDAPDDILGRAANAAYRQLTVAG